jgi:hypothetical protein
VCLDSVNLPVKLKARPAALHFFFLPTNVNATELAAWIFLTVAYNFTCACQYHYKLIDNRSEYSLEAYVVLFST